jgi:hypothetical protein
MNFCMPFQLLTHQGLMPSDLRLWLAITARGFKAAADTLAERIHHLVDDGWDCIVGLYGLAGSGSAGGLKQSLESNVIVRAVELSYLIRTCRSSAWIRFPEELVPLNTEEVVHDPLQLRSCKQESSPTCSSGETVACFELLSRPALFMDADRAGGRPNEDVLFMCEKNVIYSKRTQVVPDMKQPT